jgi:large subunit ribosomal protein L17
MRKRNNFRQLGRSPSHKMAMLRNMVTSLIDHERIVTTVAKAKEVQAMAEKIITMAKKATVKSNAALLQLHQQQQQHQHPPPVSLSTIPGTAPGSDVVQDTSATANTDDSTATTTESTTPKDPLLTTAAAALVHGRRQIMKLVRTDVAVSKVMNVLRHRYVHRLGGYTRILKLSSPRAGDKADMAVLEYIDHPHEVRAARPPTGDGNRSSSAMAATSFQLRQQLATMENLELEMNQLHTYLKK